MLDYLFNRKLRENYQKVLTLQNANEINDFLSQLCESERKTYLVSQSDGQFQIGKEQEHQFVNTFLYISWNLFLLKTKKLTGTWIMS